MTKNPSNGKLLQYPQTHSPRRPNYHYAFQQITLSIVKCIATRKCFGASNYSSGLQLHTYFYIALLLQPTISTFTYKQFYHPQSQLNHCASTK